MSVVFGSICLSILGEPWVDAFRPDELVARTDAHLVEPTPEPSSGRYGRLLVRFRPYIPWACC